MEEESFLHSVTLRDSVTGGENARRTGRPGGAHFVLCASPLMGQDHNMSSNLAGKGPKRTLCVLRTPEDVQGQRPTDMITCQSGRGEQYASRLVDVHDTVKQVKHCILLTFTYLCFTC